MSPGDRPTAAENVLSPSFLSFASVVPYLSPVVSQSASPNEEYQARKLEVRLVSGVLVFLTLVSLVATGATAFLSAYWSQVVPGPYGTFLAVSFTVAAILFVVRMPFAWYSGVTLERSFGLMQQSIGGWFLDVAKGLAIGAVLGSIVLVALYWTIATFGSLWWLPLGAVLFVLQMLMAVIGPKLLLPLFYKLTPLDDPALRERIDRLCQRAGIRAKGIFVIGFGEKTKKANAALTGLGPAKRIVLSDTLIQNLRDDEIEAVFAHEAGHLKLRHIWLGIGSGVVSSFVALFIVAGLYGAIVTAAGSSPDDISLLPLLAALSAGISFLIGPLGLWVSRWQEFAADRYAVRLSSGESLANALTKLGRVNLADPDPHPIVEYLTYSHPSLSRRLARLRNV